MWTTPWRKRCRKLSPPRASSLGSYVRANESWPSSWVSVDTVLREADSTLEALEYVRTIPGKGTVVTYGTDSALAARDLAKADSGNLNQFRLCIEPNTAFLVAPTLTIEQKNHLGELQSRLEDGVGTRDLVASSAADAEFHIYLA